MELVDHVARFIENLTVEALPALVHFLQLAGDDVGVMLVLAHQQLDAANGVTESADGVESGCENEAYSAGGERLPVETGGTNQCAQPEVACLRHHLEPVADEDAILAAERSDVGDGGERDQIEHRPYETVRLLQLFRQCEGELESDSDGGEILIGVGAAG